MASEPAQTQTPALAAQPWRVALSLWLAMAAVVVSALWHLRHETLDSQIRELRLLSLASTDAIERGLRGTEEGLHALRAELEQGSLMLNGASVTQHLQTRAGLMPLVRSLWVLDANGQVMAQSGAQAPPDRATFFPPLESLPHQGLALSRAYAVAGLDAGVDGEVIAQAVPFSGPGQARGWIVSAMPASELLGSIAAAMLAADARMLVRRQDGARLAAVNAGPIDALAVGADAHTGAPADSQAGLSVQTFADGNGNLVGVHAVQRYGVRVLVSRDLGVVLRTWRQAAELAGVALAVLLAVMGAAVYLVRLADRRRAEAQTALLAQVSRAGRLEALGTLAGGVAHDFNNVLAGIVGFGEMAQDAAAAGSAQARHLDKLMQAALRGKALVERILAFSRGGAKASEVFELGPVVDEVLTLLSASLRSGVELETQYEAPGAQIEGDATQAFEAVMNLCTNAMQAMPQGGVLSVHLARTVITAPQVLSHTQLAPGQFVVLTVEDRGSGISPEVMEHLFEPFFTTKAAQSGTGLGLAVVFGVVSEFGGAIDVQSSPGRGARFTLYLPECTRGMRPADAIPEAVSTVSGQRVLVVDDEPELVALTVEMLSGLGYAPQGFSDSPAALKVLLEDPDGFSAVITDEVMPELTGTQLTRTLRAAGQHLPVLLVSGHGGALLAQRATAAGVTRVLSKPLQRASLARALGEVLRGR